MFPRFNCVRIASKRRDQLSYHYASKPILYSSSIIMKNATRIGTSILGTWTAQTELVTGNDKLAAYFIVHFMADPRRGRGCALKDCPEIDNHVCMIIQGEDGHTQKACHDIAKEYDVLWSDGGYSTEH